MKKTYLYFVLSAAFGFGQAVSPTINDFPSQQFGQSPNTPAFNQPIDSVAPNLVEGRELSSPYAMAFDFSVTPPILYVADTLNNRVLAFKNPNTFTPCGISAPTCGFATMVIGQRDFYSTLQGGPGRPGLNNGFTFPTSVAVDKNGNLYVLDSGNNRILRFPAPFNQTVSPPTTDLVIGQKTVNSGVSPNQGNAVPNNTTLSFGAGIPSALAIDPTNPGNLWVADYNNNRVLRYPAANLAPNTTLPQADLVLGQSAFNTTALPNPGQNVNAALFKGSTYLPTGMVFDGNGNLYVGDNYGRVLFFLTPFQVSGQSASRILGFCEANITPETATSCSATNAYGLVNPSNNSGPAGLFTDGSHLYVADAGNNRIVEYDVPSNWPAAPNPAVIPQVVQDSPPILATIGQSGSTDFTDGKANQGLPEPNAGTFSSPIGGAFNGTDMWIVDNGNNRVLGFQVQGSSYNAATRLIGQLDYPYFQPNLIEGRELFLTTGNVAGGDVAIDHSSNPPHLYIADTFNNRILGFNNALTVKPGVPADIVIGQSALSGQPGTQFYRALANNPKNDPQLQTQTGLSLPSGVIVDASGNLWVADSGNSRVLRFPAPFASGNSAETPTLVLGQQDFISQNIDATAQNMSFPYGLALFSNGSLAVSDPAFNRILIFKKPSGSDFSSGVPADIILGQTSPFNIQPSNGTAGLNLPRHMGVDSSDRLYVADSNNNRMVVFNNAQNSVNGTPSSLQENNIDLPQGLVVNQATGESWISLGNGTVWRLPEYDALSLQSNPNAPPYTQQLTLQSVPFAVTLDDANNLIVAEQSNRATFYYPKLTYQHVANYSGGTANGAYVTPLAPGQLAEIFQVGLPFNFQPDVESTNPWPFTMSDLQVTVNGQAAPIFRVDSSDIAFQVPSSTPPSGTANFLVTHPSTGEIVAAGSIPMAEYSPGFFTAGAIGSGQVAALNLNSDGTVTINSQANPVSRDGNHVLILYLTGGGVFSGGPNPPPADGFAPAPGQVSSTHDPAQLLSDSFGPNGLVPPSAVLFSGAGGFAGGWQINYLVPTAVSPGAHPLSVSIGGFTPVGPSGTAIQTIFWAK
jgi:uncharacterized protein (TIGR03437 family)